MSLQNKSSLPILLIAIDGHGGSGKSTLAGLLAKTLHAQIIHTDDFASYDNPSNWHSLIIERVFTPIKNGEELLNYPRSRWWDSHRPEPVVNQPVTQIMILEGVRALRKELRPYVSYGIFVDTPKATCLARGLARDKGQDGKPDDAIMRLWEDWYTAEEAYIKQDKPEEFADRIIDGTKPFNRIVGKIANLKSLTL